ncbi:hypothetical protein [Sphingobacterium gobiense]|nr:hypothetical protein [Sphingobacterium gobiense]
MSEANGFSFREASHPGDHRAKRDNPSLSAELQSKDWSFFNF